MNGQTHWSKNGKETLFFENLGVGGSEMMNGRTGTDEVNMDTSPNDREQPSLDPVPEEE